MNQKQGSRSDNGKLYKDFLIKVYDSCYQLFIFNAKIILPLPKYQMQTELAKINSQTAEIKALTQSPSKIKNNTT